MYNERHFNKCRGPSANTTVKIKNISTISHSSLIALCNYLPLGSAFGIHWLAVYHYGLFFPFSRIFNKWNHTTQVLLLTSFAHHVFETSQSCYIYPQFISFYCWDIPLYEYTTMNLSIHLLGDIWVISSFSPLWINSQWACVFIYLGK